MRKALIGKSFIFVMLGIFIGASVFPSISGRINYQDEDSYIFNMSTIEWWPMFRHDLAHSGYSTSPAPETSTLLWEYTTENSLFSSPSVVNDKVYIGSLDTKVYCLNADTGVKIWEYITGNAVLSSPAFYYNKIYIGSGDTKVYCLDADTGTKFWEYKTGDPVSASPSISNGKVYVSSGDDKVYCLNADTGVKIWHYTTGGSLSSSPAIVNSRIYVGSGDGKVYCLNSDTGIKIWEYATSGIVSSSPSIANSKVYVGSWDNKMYCLNASTGMKIWDYTTGDSLWSSPAVANSKVYFGSRDNKVYCLNADTGAMIWQYTTGDSVSSSPTVASGKVYVGSYDHNVYCLNADTGIKIWEYTTGSSIDSSAVVANHKVYVASDDNKMYCFYNGIVRPTVITNKSTDIGDTTTTLNGHLDHMGGATSCSVRFQYGLTTSYGSITSPETMTYPGSFYKSITNLTPGTIYHYRAVAENIAGMSFGVDIQFTTTGGAENHPPNTPTITGETNGQIQTSYDYTIQTTDPDQDEVKYQIDWGDSTITTTGLNESGEEIVIAHIWNLEGTFSVKVKAIDENNEESNWAMLTVTMPCSYNKPILKFLELLFQRYPNAFPLLQQLMVS